VVQKHAATQLHYDIRFKIGEALRISGIVEANSV